MPKKSSTVVINKYFPKPNDFDTEHDFYWYLQQDGSKKLPGLGGVFNAVNMDVYHYAGNNPVKLVDPDGMLLTLSEALELAGKYNQGAGGGVSRALKEAFGFTQEQADKAQKGYCIVTSIFLYLAINEYAGKDDYVEFIKGLSEIGAIDKNTGRIKSWDKMNKYLEKMYGLTYNQQGGKKGWEQYNKEKQKVENVFLVRASGHTSVSYVTKAGEDIAIDTGWTDNRTGVTQKSKPNLPVREKTFENVGIFRRKNE